MIKNIVFDMGNVLVRFDPELFMDRYSLTGEDRRLIRNEVFRSVEWTMLDRGVIDLSLIHISDRLGTGCTEHRRMVREDHARIYAVIIPAF